MKLSVPNLTSRRGGFYWEPGPSLRRHFPGRMLKAACGAHMPLVDAMTEATRLNQEVAAWRAAGRTRKALPAPRKAARTVEHLAERWCGWPGMDDAKASPAWRKLAPKSQSDYRNKLRIFIEEFADVPVAALRKAHLYVYWERLHAKRGTRMAQGVIQVASSMLTYATQIGWIETNPALRLKMETPRPRQVLWLPQETAALAQAAHDMGEHAIRTAIFVALHSGQRQGDILDLPDQIFTDTAIRLSQIDRIALRQSKRGARVDAPMTPQLAAVVAEQRARNRRLAVVPHKLIVDDNTGRPFVDHTFRHRFAAIRDRAAADLPTLAGKTFQDLRDTAVTRLALAGCDLIRISAISGHSPKTIETIIRHYLVMQPEMADQAIAQLSNWLNTNGVTV